MTKEIHVKPEDVKDCSTIEDMILHGLTYSEIAERTGRTRSAIAGYCRRQGLKRVGPYFPERVTQRHSIKMRSWWTKERREQFSKVRWTEQRRDQHSKLMRSYWSDCRRAQKEARS